MKFVFFVKKFSYEEHEISNEMNFIQFYYIFFSGATEFVKEMPYSLSAELFVEITCIIM